MVQKIPAGQGFYAVYFYFIVREPSSLPGLMGIPTWISYALGGFVVWCVSLNVKHDLRRKISSPSVWYFYVLIVYFFALSNLGLQPLLVTAMATIGHNLQYQGWMWIVNQRLPGGNRRRAGLWFFSTLLISIFICLSHVSILETAIGIPDFSSTVYNGLVLWHYFIDGRIWLVSKSAELSFVTG